MPRLGLRRPLELGKSTIEFRLTSGDEDIKALLEREGNISATIRQALRLYALSKTGGVVARVSGTDRTLSGLGGGQARQAADDLLGSLDAGWE